MQINDLNKIINFFLVGSLAVAVMALLWLDSLRAFVMSRLTTGIQMPATLAVLVGTLLGVSVAMFVGCVIDGLAEMLFRSKMKRLVEVRLLRKIFAADQSYQDTEACRQKFEAAWKQNSKYGSLYDDDVKSLQPFAAGLFFHTAQDANAAWVIQHHAVHVLAADYIFLVLVFTIILPILHFAGSYITLDIRTISWGWWLAFVGSLYPLGHLAIDRWLYTYEAAYRHGMIVLSEPAVETRPTDNLSSHPFNNSSAM